MDFLSSFQCSKGKHYFETDQGFMISHSKRSRSDMGESYSLKLSIACFIMIVVRKSTVKCKVSH